MLGLYRAIYRDLTVNHFHEQLVERDNYVLGYTVTKRHLHRADLVQPGRNVRYTARRAASADGGDDAASSRSDPAEASTPKACPTPRRMRGCRR
jgi:hypothetical protein